MNEQAQVSMDYKQPPNGKQSLGEARPTRHRELRVGEAELLPLLIESLKADPDGLWPLPPKMVRRASPAPSEDCLLASTCLDADVVSPVPLI